ncbi:unnamed protein product [Mytilus coruscus]|uniref:SMB domain-containing protein n=1 Tax=Mytilus coruscus TaxID=42192 RepID=A0A6J8A4F1_MYTCO|nr:unnamed protein product [Mytilus coruscus]
MFGLDNNIDLQSTKCNNKKRRNAAFFDGKGNWDYYSVQFELIGVITQLTDTLNALEIPTSLGGNAQSIWTDLRLVLSKFETTAESTHVYQSQKSVGEFNELVGRVLEPAFSFKEEFTSTINPARTVYTKTFSHDSTSMSFTDLENITREREPFACISKIKVSSEDYYSTTLDKRQQATYIYQVTKLQTSADFKFSTQSSLMDPCFHVGSCSFTSTMIHQFCKCDNECQIYNDCCQDYNKEPNTFRSGYFEHLACIRGHNDKQSFEGYFAVTSCPSDYENKTVITRCYEDDIINNGPSVANESIVFKNKFCALCHQVTDYVFFRLIFTISDETRKHIFNVSRAEKLQYLITRNKLYKTVPPQNVSIRPCIVDLTATDIPSCIAYINPVFQFSSNRSVIMYRNHVCVPLGQTADCLGHLYDKIAVIERFTIYPLSVMFSFTAMTKTTSKCSIWNEQIEEKDTCSFQETYTNMSFHVDVKLISDKRLQAIDILHISLLYALTFDIGNLTSWKEYRFFINEENPTDVSISTLIIKIHKTMFEQEGNNFIQMANNLKWQLRLYDEITGETFTVDKHSKKTSQLDVIQKKTQTLNYDELFVETKFKYSVDYICPLLKKFS